MEDKGWGIDSRGLVGIGCHCHSIYCGGWAAEFSEEEASRVLYFAFSSKLVSAHANPKPRSSTDQPGAMQGFGFWGDRFEMVMCSHLE